MYPTSVLEAATAELLANDPDTLAPAVNKLRVHLVSDEFAPGLATDFADLTPVTFTGGAFKEATAGPCQSYYDPVAQERVIQLNEPAGGWHWQCTVAPDPQQVVRGYVVTDSTDAITFGSGRFPTSIPITNVGDGVDIANVQIRLKNGFFQQQSTAEETD